MTTLFLHPAMPLHGPVDSDHATWVGAVDAHDLSPSLDRVSLVDAEAFARARLLVRDGRALRGYAEVAVSSGEVNPLELRAAIDGLPAAASTPPSPAPPISVVVCTHERAALLRDALDSIAQLDYPDFEIVVVDNAPKTTGTRDLVDERYPQARYVREDRVGLSWARNAGLAAARHPVVAFTDDDVIADPAWLRGVADGFARADDIACVTGVVPSGELRNAVQTYFDERVNWSNLTAHRTFRLSDPPADLPMFPFCVGEYGTGANFAVRRDAVLELGSFDTALGAGTQTKGGEDLDMFVRLLFAGHALTVEPSSIIWHRHRSDLDALRAQAIGYGRGLGAWLVTLTLSPRMLRGALARAPKALRVLLAKRAPNESTSDAAADALATDLADLNRLEVRSVLDGPRSYVRERRRQRMPGPVSDGELPAAAPAAVPQVWLWLAGAASVLGLLGAIPSPVWVSAPLVIAFVVLGPGALVRAWVSLPPHLTPLAVGGVGAAAVVLSTTASVMAGLWAPVGLLIGVAITTLAGAIVSAIVLDPVRATYRSRDHAAAAPVPVEENA